MGLFDNITPSGDITVAQKQWETSQLLTRFCSDFFRLLCNNYKTAFDLINNNPYGLAKEDVVAGLHPDDWAKLYNLAVGLKNIINTAAPGTIIDDVGVATATASESSSSTVMATAT